MVCVDNIWHFYETPDLLSSSVPEIWDGSFRMNKMFIRPEARLNIVHFQKESVSRDQLTEDFNIGVVPEKLYDQGRTLINSQYNNVQVGDVRHLHHPSSIFSLAVFLLSNESK